MSDRTLIAINALAATRGGAVTHLPRFVAALQQARPDFDIVVYHARDRGIRIPPPAIAHAIDVSSLPRRLREELARAGGRARRQGAACLVNLLNSGPPLARIPMVTFQRNALYFDRSWLRSQPVGFRSSAALRRAMAYATCHASSDTVVPTIAMAEMLTEWRGGSGLQPKVVPHGIDIACFPYQPRQLSSQRVRLGVMGHPAAHRGLDLAVRVVGALRRHGVDASLALTVPRRGNPAFQSYVDSVWHLVQSEKLVQHIDFDGPSENPSQWYRSIDVLLVPSLCESFGYPVLEGFASGTPVVTTNLRALVEVGKDVALHFPRSDSRGATGAILELLDEKPDLAAERVSRGRTVAEAHDWSIAVLGVAEIIGRLVESPGEPCPRL